MVDLQEKIKEIKEFVINNKRNVSISLGVFIVVVIILCLTLNDSEESQSINYGPFGGFAQCLTVNNVKVYGTSWCAACDAAGLPVFGVLPAIWVGIDRVDNV